MLTADGQRFHNRYSDSYASGVATPEWNIYVVNEVREWIDALDA
jgi:hypothetical protein